MHPETIFVGHTPGTYKAYKTIGGWGVMFLDKNNNSRNADGGKIYKHRPNAYRRTKQLNDQLVTNAAQVEKENELLVALCRELGHTEPDEELIEGCRSNHQPNDIRDAANGDVAALANLRRAFGLPIFV